MKKLTVLISLILTLTLLCCMPALADSFDDDHRVTTSYCNVCGKWTDSVFVRYQSFGGYGDTSYCCVVRRCTGCNREYKANHYDHIGGTATCTEKAVCTRCGGSYGKIDANNHDYDYDSTTIIPATCTSGEKLLYTCKRCSASYSVPLVSKPLGHKYVHHDAKSATCTEIGWNAYETCSRCEYSTYEELPALEHNLAHHDAKDPTCTEIGWNAYDTCSRCEYSTYEEIPALEHDLIHHDAKDPTCTEIGWNAYDTCSRCEYSTYEEIPALEHDLAHHDAKSPTCTEIGWKAYVTCSRCDYSTYEEIPATGHSYQSKFTPATCTKKGFTAYTCTVCGHSYKKNVTRAMLHWYGEWAPIDDSLHEAECKRSGCGHIGTVSCETFWYIIIDDDVENEDPTEYVFNVCPVCGIIDDETRLEWIEKATVEALTEELPKGELIVRMGENANGDVLLSVGFEYAGKLTQPIGEVKVTLPAELLEDQTLFLLDEDGTETALSFTIEDDLASFTLDFTDAEDPAVLIHVVTAE